MSTDYNTRETLLQKLQKAEDEHSWDDFVKYYEGYIYVVIRSFGVDINTSEDLLQDVLIKVWKALPKFEYHNEKCRFRTWLCVLIRNTTYNFFKSKANRQSNSNVSYDDLLSSLNLISEPEIDKIAELEWKSYVSNLAWENVKDGFSDAARQVFESSIIGESNDTIAAKFNIPESSVRVHRSRIKKVLIKEIARLNIELGG
ncbi:sigma-70 family RNA polymerase sigma factor [Lentisphaera profundi]|uniref:RNA polymerase sigma factor SigS n=1 Tax=Lentisphaera profundi TaxID=1658616 RepID=A0ABY7VWF0_9BACT|nr:sigma-70 family RNA polymerase sigma factor [Lentisphaera profundi]WDE97589.1 sigma-70 family RNA polymerase sigma factor [Lentisphaera profundi]